MLSEISVEEFVSFYRKDFRKFINLQWKIKDTTMNHINYMVSVNEPLLKSTTRVEKASELAKLRTENKETKIPTFGKITLPPEICKPLNVQERTCWLLDNAREHWVSGQKADDIMLSETVIREMFDKPVYYNKFLPKT